MKRSLIVFLAVALLSLTACSKKEESKPVSAQGVHTGKVIDKINASNYSYLQLEENGNTYWIAAPQMQIEKGETVQFAKSMEMKNFHSETLNRTWETILFVSDVAKNGQLAQPTMGAHPQVKTDQEQVKVDPVKGGKTVAEVYAQKESLSGKPVTVRGKVVKYNAGIMGKNWIHIQDGTNSQGNYDLLVTSTDEAQVGSVITVEGKVSVNKDFGAGYSYSVLLEDCKVKK
ncbi:MAG: hypothetical protein ACM3UR_05955 [Bacteroidota bacterium]|jgi:uncharacterized cupredoxin-like copper-binding protein|nr:hypothetical protein [Ignavibacteria bacterium]MCU7513744.1 hypothetical protein [Ignavibacteria bacterium]MCU7525619.1 hypothetical protein [Ignavibacteria bacterium]HEX2962613.1 hypothetical protein [Ignavibacteriales bacterium]